MTATYDEAEDTCIALFEEEFLPAATIILGYAPEIYHQKRQFREPPLNSEKADVYFSFHITEAGQGTLNRPGSRRFDREGFVNARIRVPVDVGDNAYNLCRSLAIAAVDVFEGVTTPNDIEFRNAKLFSPRPDPGVRSTPAIQDWHQFTVTAELFFDIVK